MNQRILVIAAHPDDEVLGCGGAIAWHSDRGDTVRLLIVAEGSTSRYLDKTDPYMAREIEALKHSAGKAARILGADGLDMLGLPDNRLDSIDRLDLTKRIEEYIFSYKPQRIYIHHHGDLNVDHRRIHEAVMTACRPLPGTDVVEILSFEVVSSTEWQIEKYSSFQPNWFIDISCTLDRKLDALKAYQSEMRNWPHARSIEAIFHQAKYRGSQVGVEAAEAFMLCRRIEK